MARHAVEVQIANFGQTPTQLFTRPHPPRAPRPLAADAPGQIGGPAAGIAAVVRPARNTARREARVNAATPASPTLPAPTSASPAAVFFSHFEPVVPAGGSFLGGGAGGGGGASNKGGSWAGVESVVDASTAALSTPPSVKQAPVGSSAPPVSSERPCHYRLMMLDATGDVSTLSVTVRPRQGTAATELRTFQVAPSQCTAVAVGSSGTSTPGDTAAAAPRIALLGQGMTGLTDPLMLMTGFGDGSLRGYACGGGPFGPGATGGGGGSVPGGGADVDVGSKVASESGGEGGYGPHRIVLPTCTVSHHADAVSCVASQGQFVVLGSADGTASVWRVMPSTNSKKANLFSSAGGAIRRALGGSGGGGAGGDVGESKGGAGSSASRNLSTDGRDGGDDVDGVMAGGGFADSAITDQVLSVGGASEGGDVPWGGAAHHGDGWDDTGAGVFDSYGVSVEEAMSFGTALCATPTAVHMQRAAGGGAGGGRGGGGEDDADMYTATVGDGQGGGSSTVGGFRWNLVVTLTSGSGAPVTCVAIRPFDDTIVRWEER